MEFEREEVSFEDLIARGVLEIGDGYRAKLEELGGDGPIFMRAGQVQDTHIDFEGVDRFYAHLADQVKNKMSRAGDVIVTTKGNSTGRVGFVDSSMPAFVYSPHLSYWRSLDHQRLIPGFLRYWSRGTEFRGQLQSLSRSTDMAPYLSLVDQRRLIISVPSPQEQRAIANILGTLDDKIELNRRMNETLEAIARAIFKSWFVDFDPVRAKAGGEVPELTCRRLGLTAELLALFPDRFQDSELGEIPKGWHYSTAGLVADVGIGKTPPRKEPHWFSENPADIRWVSIRDMGDAGTYIQDTSEFLTPEAVSRFNVRVVPHDTVLLSFKLTVGRVAISDGEMCTNEAIAHFRLIPGCLSTEYLFEYLRAFDYSQLGSTSSIAEAVNSKSIREMHVLVPDKLVVTAYTMTVASLFAQIRRNTSETTTLSTLRDLLLPRLLSGEVRVQTELLQERL